MSKTKEEYSEQLIRDMHRAFNILGDGWELNEEMSDVYDQALKVAQEYAEQENEEYINEIAESRPLIIKLKKENQELRKGIKQRVEYYAGLAKKKSRK